jgi:hypothetical protein
LSHFAELDENNEVIRVLVGNNDDPNGDEGYKWLIDNLGGRWVQTSYNGNFRKQYAAIGFTYDSDADVFIKPSPYKSWVLDNNYDWQAPVAYPTDGANYYWDEDSISWKPEPTQELEA